MGFHQHFNFDSGRIGAFVFFVLILFFPAGARSQGPETDLLIHDVRVVDFGEAAPRVRERQSVLVRGDRIVAVAPVSGIVAPKDARIIEGRGRYLVPGLTDMHVHIWDEAELGAYLSSGVTTVRNMSGMPIVLAMRDEVAAGARAGPRILTTGPILNSAGPNAQLNHQIVETGEEARAAVRMQHDQGYRRIKVYSNLNRDAYTAIRDEAARLGMAITGHTPEGRREAGIPFERPFLIAFEELLDDGFETVEHVESIVWHGLRERHDIREGRELAGRIAAAHLPVDPTLIAFANLVRIAETRGAHLRRAGTDMLNPFIRSMETAQSDRWASEDAARARRQLQFYQRFTCILSEEGVLLVAGSDAGIATNIPGTSLHDELDLLLEAGLTPHQALRAATTNAARALGEEAVAGRILPGFRADLLLVDDDPLADIAALRRPAAVLAGGHHYDSAALAELRASARRTDFDRTRRNVFGAMAAQGTAVD